MSEKDRTQASTKHRRSSQTSKQNGKQSSALQRPHDDDKEAWKAYWYEQDQTWRIEPEISMERQKYLAERRSTTPDIERGVYPFKDIKLDRADVEWLLTTHDDGHGPIDWSNENQREREGLDLRGANLQEGDLRGLPLAGMIGGLTGSAWFYASPEQCEMAAVRMNNTILIQTHLEGAKLNQAYLKRANLFRANLEGAELRAASFEGAYLNESFLGGVLLRRAHLEGAHLGRAHLEGTSTPPADLRGAFFDSATILRDITLGNKMHGYVCLADIRWGGVNLSRIDWTPIDMLGDEYEALRWNISKRKQLSHERENEMEALIDKYWAAVRANRQLAIALQGQGLNEYARRFAYRAPLLRRKILCLHLQRPQRRVWRWVKTFTYYLTSLFFDFLAGYGYKPFRSVLAYLLIVGLFSMAYFLFGVTSSGQYHLEWYEAIVVSLTAFHGRGFFSEQFKPGDPQAFIAAAEAVVGLLLEISFIASFTQRFFEK